MNLKSVIVVLAAVIAGTLGAAVTYQVAVPAGNAQAPTTESIVLKSPGEKARPERRKARFAPCKPPAKLEGRRCVTDVVRTVVVADQSAPAAPAPAPRSSGSSFNDDSRHGDDDSGYDDSRYDDDDDHSGPGGGGDDDDDTGTHTRTRSGTHTGGNTGTQTRTRSHD